LSKRADFEGPGIFSREGVKIGALGKGEGFRCSPGIHICALR